jgi:putative acetyltransferase
VPDGVRAALESEAPEIARVWYDAWRDAHLGHVPEALLRHRHAEQFLVRAERNLARTWVAENAGRVVGFVTVDGDELEHLFIERAARGSGIAVALLRRGLEAIRRGGHRRAWLAVVAGNARARAFYEREGWRDAGAIDSAAETAEGRIPVPSRRYEIDLAP